MIDQGELFDIPSPCRGICTANNRGYCKGCFRSREERFHWHEFSNFHKQLIINACEKRRLKVLAARTAQQAGLSAEQAAVYDTSVMQPDLFGTEQSTPTPETAVPPPIAAEKRHSPGANSQGGLFDENS